MSTSPTDADKWLSRTTRLAELIPLVTTRIGDWGAPWADRRLRLAACACLRLAWDKLTPPDQAAVVLAERFASGQAAPGEREAYHHELLASRLTRRRRRMALRAACFVLGRRNATAMLRRALLLSLRIAGIRNDTLSPPHEAAFREVMGNPWCAPAPIAESVARWQDGTVIKLASSIDAERRFEDLPVLADALEDAGGADGALLNHLRSPGPHVLGCWALDCVLGYPPLTLPT
jgi:hypothetical protein